MIPTRVMALGMAFTLALVLLAGCSGGGSAEDAVPSSERAEPGSLRGVVVDAAIRPLEGALVSIPARPAVIPVTTDADGNFVLADVDAGVVFLEVTKDRYLSASVQALMPEGEAPALVQVVLLPLEESRPYAVLESFRGFMECGIGSAPAFGLTAGCKVTLGSALYIACTGSDPVPPTGVCLGGTSPYFESVAAGNMSVAQTEVVWDATVSAMSELLIGSYVMDRDGVIQGGAPGASGHSVLVRRLNATVVDELDLGRANHLALFVNPGNSGPANAVVQQTFDVYHTSTFLFEPDVAWVFARDGPVPIPDECQACLSEQ